jgi:hypothetical protein
MTSPGVRMTSRSMMFDSSRTFPATDTDQGLQVTGEALSRARAA